jgi:hypothetical protein
MKVQFLIFDHCHVWELFCHQITEIPRDECGFLKYRISVRGGYCDPSAWAPENLATPLFDSETMNIKQNC